MLLKAGYNRYILLCIILKLKNDVRLNNDEFRQKKKLQEIYTFYFIYNYVNILYFTYYILYILCKYITLIYKIYL